MRTRVGYAGGRTPNPNYDAIADHSECVQIDYDPAVLSYQQLLGFFWEGKRGERPSFSRQYRSAILWHDEAQKQLALESKAAAEKARGMKLAVDVEPLDKFTLAEDYHQKYYLRQDRVLFAELSRIYPDERAFVDSTAVARANGFVGGYGTDEERAREVPRLGLSEKAQQLLLHPARKARCSF